jgi:L-seryl-tRNA(Ser) seleniumtransferase
MKDEAITARMRALPSVDRLATAVARAELDARRAELLAGATGEVDLVERASARLAPRLRPVLNATGVILHTNLGRAPLAAEARAAIARVAAGYCNLELDLSTGRRGSRHDHVGGLLAGLSGAEAAIVVNNGAAAVLLAVAALGAGGETLVSRGQLIEIGGGFRIPEMLALTDSSLVEVGTTNRTRIGDYERAINDNTRVILRVHPSNFRTLGFVEEVTIEELCMLHPPVIDDIGSGVLAEGIQPIAEEPMVRRSVAAGATVVTFSGDKLLGGPQSGILVGTQDAIEACSSHPLARAVRIDKFSLAALEATLQLYRDPVEARTALPVLAMLEAGRDELLARAELLAEATGGRISEGTAYMGGGALPLLELSGPVLALQPGALGVDALAATLRNGDPPLLGRIHAGELLLDPRTLTDNEARLAGRLVVEALG